MSSRFVPAGTVEESRPNEDEWEKANRDIEETRRRKEEESRQEGGKSLYEILQQNKAAKQEAFEESIRLKNQFRSLDEDEVEFLDSVLESTRAKEEAVKKETLEQLDIFRRQQEEVDKALLLRDNDSESPHTGEQPAGEEQWKTSAKKRRRTAEKETLRGVKLRKSSTLEQPTSGPSAKAQPTATASEPKRSSPEANPPSQPSSVTAKATNVTLDVTVTNNKTSDVAQRASDKASAGRLLGLNYSSEEDSD